MHNGTRLAAVDLGSNSFRLEIVRLDHGQFEREAYLKETIRQGSGLDADRNLIPQAMQLGWDCLARFGERLAGFEPHQVRAVATQTLREARNREAFLARANQALGFPIDVISGRDEARLIYQGVSLMLPPSDERRLVVDIGGRSTELILGRGADPTSMESYRLGSISWSTRYFGDGHLSQGAFDKAEVAAKALLDEAVGICGPSHWDGAYGSAGTIGAVAEILHLAGDPPGQVSREGLDWLRAHMIQAQSADKLRLAGLKEDRRAILAGGVSILRALFELLEIETMRAAEGGLRHGLLCEMSGTLASGRDLREASVKRLMAKFGTDAAHARRVHGTALHLFRQLQPASMADEDGAPSPDQLLGWAGRLHEIGTAVAHVDHHKHGAYLLDNTDALGFTIAELHRLSLLVLGQRGKLRKLEADFGDEVLMRQLLALRLAVILCHARRDPDTAGLQLVASPGKSGPAYMLSCRKSWPVSFPQSAHLLREEQVAWQKTPVAFSFAPG